MSVVLLVDAKRHLNIEAQANDGELQAMLDGAEDRIAKSIGPLQPEEQTVRVDGCREFLRLVVTPVISLTSVTPVGGADIAADCHAYPSGRVELNAGGMFTARRYDVVYQAGRADLSPNIELAIKELVRAIWEKSKRGAKRPGRESDALANTMTQAPWTLPFSVSQLLASELPPGVA